MKDPGGLPLIEKQLRFSRGTKMKDLIVSCLESRVEDDGVMYGRFLFGPAPRGLAVTIANALRRSLLSEVSGFAITHVEFNGPKHEYSTLPGTQETVLDVLLNLKKLVFTSTSQTRRKMIGYCSGQGPGVLTGRDLKLPPGVQCTNPDHVIAHLAVGGHLDFSFLISSGKNYVMTPGAGFRPQLNSDRRQLLKLMKFAAKGKARAKALEQKKLIAGKGDGKRLATSVFAIDAVFMPVLRVNFLIASDEDTLAFPMRKNSLEVSERLILEIWTNGNLTPREAMHQASTQLLRVLSLFQKPSQSVFRPRLSKKRVKITTTILNMKHHHALQAVAENHFLPMDIGVLPISPSLFIELKKNKIDRLADFINLTYEDLRKISGMTPNVLFEMLCSLRSYGIRFLPVWDGFDAG
jgi:DNA-directed RNA polymerase subunit alpha